MATISTLKENIKNIKISERIFHNSQNIWRKFQSCGLQININNSKFKQQVKILMCVAFVPDKEIISMYEGFYDCLLSLEISREFREILIGLEITSSKIVITILKTVVIFILYVVFIIT